MPDLSPDQTVRIALILGLVILTVAIIDAVLFIAWALRRDRVSAGLAPPLFAPRWSLVDVWIGGQLVIGLLVAIGIPLLVMGLLLGRPAPGSEYVPPLGLMFLFILLQNLLLIAVPAWFILYKYRVTLPQIGLTRRPGPQEWRIGLLAGVALMLVAAGMESGLMWLLHQLLPPSALKSVQETTRSFSVEQLVPKEVGASPLPFALLFFGVAIVTPFGEEFFFRGFLYNAAKRRLGVPGGIVLSAVVFAVVHGGPLLVIAIIPMGILLAVMYERSGSLWVPIIMHALNNGLALVLTYFVMGTST